MRLLILFIVISALQAQASTSDVYLSNFTKTDGVIFKSDKNSDIFAGTLRNAGDFNGDGYDDIIIGAQGTNNSAGTVYVVFGSKSGLADATLTYGMGPNQGLIIYGANTGDWLGYSVSGAGDVNDDGIDDIIIGTTQADLQRGKAYVIYGNKNPPSIIDLSQGLSLNQGFTILGANEPGLLGVSVSGIGDFNKDGIDDFIIGASGMSSYKGAAYVIFGVKGSRGDLSLASGLSASEGFVIFCTTMNCQFGASVNRAGDVNSDGIDDVIVGALGENSSAGSVYVIYGKQSNSFAPVDVSQGLSQSEGFAIKMGSSFSFFGTSIGSAGDFNKDGKDDIIIGANMAESAKGAAFVIFGQGGSNSDISFGSGVLDSSRGLKIIGEKMGDFLGISVSAAGDLNGDGTGDIIVGAYNANNAARAVYVVYGREGSGGTIDLGDGLDLGEGYRIIGAQGDRLGVAVSRAGDVNQDGIDDIILGGYGGASSAGIAYLIIPSVACPEHCLTCETNGLTCLACVDGYGLYNSLCVSPCPPSMELVNGVCVKIKSPLETAVKVSKGLFDASSTASRIFTLGRSLSVSLGLIAKIIQNVRFLNISYPEEALNAFENYGTSLWEPSVPEILYAPPETKELASQYSRYDSSPSFLENYWQTIMMMLLCLGCFLVIRILQYITRRQPRGGFLQVALKNMGQTAINFIIVQVYSNLDDVVFFLVLDGSTTKLNSPSARLSLSAAGFFFFIGIALVVFHCWVLGKYQQAREKNQLESFKKKFRIVGTLYEDFKDDSAVKQSFFGILILRCVVLILIIMLLGPPWVQASLLMFSNLIFLGFIIHQRPYVSLFDEIVQYFCELTVFVAYLSVLILSILDEKEDFTANARNGLGKSIVISGIVLCLGGFIVQVIQIAGVMIEIYKFCKSSLKPRHKISVSPEVLELKSSPQQNVESISVEASNLSILKDSNRLDSIGVSRSLEKNVVITGEIGKFLAEKNNDLEISYMNSESTLIIDKRNSRLLERLDHNKLKKENFAHLAQRARGEIRPQYPTGSFGDGTERGQQLGEAVGSLESEIPGEGKSSRKYKRFKRRPRFPAEFNPGAL